MMNNTTLKDYPYWGNESQIDARKSVQDIAKIRKDDITKFKNLINVFLQGRTVGKIPANSGDVTPDDKLGDTSFDDANMYVLQNESSPQWIKYAGSIF